MITMRTKLAIAIAVLLILVAGFAILIALPAPANAPTASSTSSGTSNAGTPFTYDDKVKVKSPLPNASVMNSFTVKGEARGPWYFEAVFPVQVIDKDNNKIAKGQAHAEGEWTTNNYVPFTADITVSNYRGAATLVLLKDNPSGLPENDDSVSIPITIQ